MQNNNAFRDVSDVMCPDRIGAMHQNRISFVRSVLRKMYRENWQVTQHVWDMDDEGYGIAIYKVVSTHSTYNLVVFSNQIEDHERNDRVIAEKWDVTFSLVEGEVTKAFLKQMQANVTLQEAGRNTSRSLVLARANKSVRVFNMVVDALSAGLQPDIEEIASVGYILRTTAVYGNGKFGIADFELLKEKSDFRMAFSAQMCACYLLREFSIDWVNFLAEKKGGDKAVTLDKHIARYLGTGNATGLGMAPYLINHPRVVDAWMSAREKAINAVASQTITKNTADECKGYLQKAIWHLSSTQTIDERQNQLNNEAVSDIEKIIKDMDGALSDPDTKYWQQLVESNNQYGYESQEIFLTSIVELYPALVDEYELELNSDESLFMADGLTIGDIKTLMKARYQWAIDIDFSNPENEHIFWYKSEAKEEPRLGVREEEDGAIHELPLDIARQVNRFNIAIADLPDDASMAQFLLKNQKYRGICRRMWTMGNSMMGDIQMNVLHKDTLPIHLLRCKLAMFGATKFDPRSDKWLQVTFFQGAPLLDELHDKQWIFPIPPALSASSKQIKVTYNELFNLVFKSYNALKLSTGEVDRIANMVTALEMVNLPGIRYFASSINHLTYGTEDIDINEDHDEHITVDLKGNSVLCHLPAVLYYARERLLKQNCINLRIENSYNRWLAYGELQKLAERGFNVHAHWGQDDADIQVEFFSDQEHTQPDLYIHENTESSPYLDIVISKTSFEPKMPTKHCIHLSSELLTQTKRQSLKDGFEIDLADWEILANLAKTSLVAESEASKMRGAGGV